LAKYVELAHTQLSVYFFVHSAIITSDTEILISLLHICTTFSNWQQCIGIKPQNNSIRRRTHVKETTGQSWYTAWRKKHRWKMRIFPVIRIRFSLEITELCHWKKRIINITCTSANFRYFCYGH